MISWPLHRFARLISFSALICFFAAAILFLPLPGLRGQERKSSDPWSSSQALQPADLASTLADKSSPHPTVICVGFHTLFEGGHVPGASFHGSAAFEAGLADLKKVAEALPRSSEIIIYCGCCPLDKCPNVRPAFAALNSMGFKKLRVLVLPTNFATDWVGKGYPMERGM